jgi:hypothetical protein
MSPTTRPVLLERALERVTSREEEQHPIFQRCFRRLSLGILVLNLLQWPCFFAHAVLFLHNTDGELGVWEGRRK